jgi:hypothetical protein
VLKIRLVCSAILLGAASACASAVDADGDLGTAKLGLAAPLEIRGFLTRTFGNARANRCAVDVPGAFRRLPGSPTGKVRYRSMGGRALPPYNARLAEFGDWDAHVQSIVRLSLPWEDNLWAAVSRATPGNTGGGGVFLVHLADGHGADGTRWVLPGDDFTGEPPAGRETALYYPISGTAHPGGMQAVGEFLVVASEGPEGEPPLVDILQRTPSDVAYSEVQRFTLYGDLGEPVAPSRFITAAALSRLSVGRYLLFVLGKDEDQQGWFYVSDQTSLTADTTWTFLDHVEMPWFYQNVALVTECDTREIYLIATNNVDYDGSANSGVEYADLMHFGWDAASSQVDLSLTDLRAFAAGGAGYCTFRAAATPFVDKDGNLLLYCHAYKANTDLFGNPDSKLKLVEYAAD